MRIVAAHLPSTPTRNIFEAAETPTSEKRLVRAAVNKKEMPPPIPVPVVAMPVVPPAPPRCPLRKKWPNRLGATGGRRPAATTGSDGAVPLSWVPDRAG